MLKIYKKVMLVMLMGMSHAAMSQALVGVQAESGTRSSDTALEIRTADGVTYITTTLNTATPSDAPQTASRVATYTITFPAAGTYDLYTRVRVGVGTFNDDSFYYSNGFGTKSPTAGGDWITVNGLAGTGYTAATDVVGAPGTAGSMVWKWLKLSAYNDLEPGITFVVPAAQLTQTFQIGSREDGLDFDKFAFGISGQSFTVAQLDAIVITSLKKDTQVAFDVYPNPVSNGRFVVNSQEKITSVQVIDSKGSIVKEFANVSQFSTEFNLNIKPGLYIVQINSGNTVASRRLVVN